jgi:hypothetical protein
LHGPRLGTLYFDNFGNLLDQFLVSRPLLERRAPLHVTSRAPGSKPSRR